MQYQHTILGFIAVTYVLADASGSGAFQTLAQGTQDLAALVGLFATDSVERYSVDYLRGRNFIQFPSKTASDNNYAGYLSLLGILGYVRAMVKLSMGSKSCQDSAFPTAPVRAILGVAESDRLPKEELVTVSYISRTTVRQNTVTYQLIKRLNRTQGSFPAAKVLLMPITNEPLPGEVYKKYILDNFVTPFRTNLPVLTRIWGSLTVTAAATSFPVIGVSREWTWTRILATFGLFVALVISSIMWSYVYVKEQMPTRMTHDTELDQFAIMRPANRTTRPVVCDLHAITGRWLQVYRVISMITALAICVWGMYISQYIEIRNMSTPQAAWWLGVQIGLALLRVIIWIWEPKFDNYDDFRGRDIPIYN
ncbi:hypothetical protein BDD12DRAFT_931273 [Trichophaea hybrida]|nr:hypothetical protein BDD12DRAFT_931273 [Trichophaea hybrida]